jgi:hypothetical protein
MASATEMKDIHLMINLELSLPGPQAPIEERLEDGTVIHHHLEHFINSDESRDSNNYPAGDRSSD